MYPFPQTMTPAARSHIDAHFAFMNELSHTMSRSFQDVYQLNMRLGQALFEQATGTMQRMLTAGHPGDALSAAVSQAQPAGDKLRAHQQQLSQLAATTRVDLTRVTGQHGQETSRTAGALAADMGRAAAEQTDKGLHQQEEIPRNSPDALTEEAERGATKMGAEFQGALQRVAEGIGGKPDGQAGPLGVPANTQGGNIQGGKMPSR